MIGAITCREARPVADGKVVVRDVVGARLERVVAALHESTAAQKSVCDAAGRILPAFALQLADRTWVHPQVPTDGCHPRQDVVQALNEAAN